MKTIAEIMQGFVPVEQREWWGFKWPTADWLNSAAKKHPRLYKEFWAKVRKYCDDDLFFFSNEIMRNPSDEPLCIGLHDEICFLAQSGEDLGMLIPRNHLKSTLITHDYVLWKLAKDPRYRFLIVSASPDTLAAFIGQLKTTILDNDWLHAVYPQLKPQMVPGERKRMKWAALKFNIEGNDRREASVTGMTTEKTMTGQHFDEELNDDVVTSDNVTTAASMEKIIDGVYKSFSLLDVNKKTGKCGRKLFIGTPYDFKDVYSWAREHKVVDFYVRQAIEMGRYLWPFQMERVKEMKRSLPRHEFNCQYLCDPTPKGDREINLGEAKRWNPETLREHYYQNSNLSDSDLVKMWMNTLNRYITIDPAWSELNKSDWTCMTCCGSNKDGVMFPLAKVRGKWANPVVAAEKFCDFFEEMKPVNAKIETYGAGRIVLKDYKNAMIERGLNATRLGELEKPWRMDNIDRIRQIIRPLHLGMIVLPDGPDWEELEDEINKFPFAPHDDILTCIAYCYTQQARKKVEPREKVDYGWQSRFGFGAIPVNHPYSGGTFMSR